MTHTNKSVLERFGIANLAIEFPELVVPVISGTQRQGDVLVLQVDSTPAAGVPLGRGVNVVRGESGGNTHALHGNATWHANPSAADKSELTQGWLTVPAGGEAFLTHEEEHSAIGIGPGTYEIRRQREYAGEWRRVSD